MPRSRDDERLQRTQNDLERRGLDAVICRLSDNVLLLSGYWPMSGMSWAITARGQEPVVVAPRGEEEWVADGWAGRSIFYGWGGVNDPPVDEQLARIFTQLSNELGLNGKRVGFEGSAETIAPAFMAGEEHVSSRPSFKLLYNVWGQGLVDATTWIEEWRSSKTPLELDGIRLANEVAALGLQAFVDAAVPGAVESEVSAAAEAAVYGKGPGYKGAKRCRAWGEVASGPDEGAIAWYQYSVPTPRRIEEGDTCLLEMGTVVDGYWSDLTRTVIAGKASDRTREAFEAAHAAQQAGIDALRAGVLGSEVHEAARSALEKIGWAWAFPHGTGHGVGYRYHESLPLLVPGYDKPLQAGVVVTVEPGVYDRSFGGIRTEDNLLVTENGHEFMSTFSRDMIITGG